MEEKMMYLLIGIHESRVCKFDMLTFVYSTFTF